MKRQFLITLSILLAAVGFATARDLPYKQGELIVRFAEPVETEYEVKRMWSAKKIAARKATLKAAGGGSVRRMFKRVSGLSVVKLPAGVSVQDALESFNNTPGILYAVPNHKYKLFDTFPNDSFFDDLWGMHNTGQTGGTEDADIDAPEAWDIHTGSSDIIVAVTDTGVDYNHPDLQANMWTDANGFYGYDFAGADANDPNDGDNDPMDIDGHGTHVAGIIGAVGDNNVGVTGVCWDVKIMALKIQADNAEYMLTTDAIDAIEYAIDNGANVINASWGSNLGDPFNQPLYDAIENAGDAGILFVAAAGNDYGNNNDTNPVYPGSYNLDNIISVMATNHNDDMSGFSNYGPNSVDIGAPGTGIRSCYPGDNYDWMGGTSMATPYVAGACALMWSVNPNFTHTTIKKLLLDPNSVDQIPALDGLCVSNGRLNLFNAVSMMVSSGVVLNTTTYARYETVQNAINDANDLDELIADTGNWYFENIDFLGKAITLRSGDIDNPADPNISPENTYIGDSNGSAVTFQSSEDANSVLKGFTITGGYTTQNGGGIYCDGSSPTIENCIITGNYAGKFGGGIYCKAGSPKIENCIIKDNYADWSGGGIYTGYNNNALISQCTISTNDCGVAAGGIYSFESSPIIKNCIITDNSGYWSGGISSSDSNSTIINCTIADNLAINGPGGLQCYYDGNAVVVNSILWYNTGEQICLEDGGTVSVTYSDIQMPDSNEPNDPNIWPGDGNIDADPLFFAPEISDYHLKSTGGRWTGLSRTNGDFNDDGIVDLLDLKIFTLYWLESGSGIFADLHPDDLVDFADFAVFASNWLKPGENINGWTEDSVTSPCIDAGDSSEYSLEPAPNGERINMGTYGNTEEASKSP